MVDLGGLKVLPSTNVGFKKVGGYPGKGFWYGSISTQVEWAAFQSSIDDKQIPEFDFSTQTVLFIIFDAQTNSLGLKSWESEGDKGRLVIEWFGEEMFIDDATPAVLVAVHRQALVEFEAIKRDVC